MASNWSEYQQDVAEFFRSLCCTAEIEKQVVGARGTHDVDVWVTFSVLGVEITWLVECKFWKSAVSKEKVLVLSQIAQDVGADRAFLLSESGFQAGAIRMAEKTNLTLSNLEELRANAKSDMLDRAMRSLAQKAHNIQNRLHDVFALDDHTPGPWPGADREVVIDLLSQVFAIKAIWLPKAQAGEFPVVVGLNSGQALNAEQMVAEVSRELQNIGTRLTELEAEVGSIRIEAQETVTSLAEAVNELFTAGERALFGVRPSEDAFEGLRLAALAAMKRVGTVADRARPLIAGRAAADLHALMRTLIDGAYLDLSQPVVNRQRWDKSARAAESALHKLSQSVGLTRQ